MIRYLLDTNALSDIVNDPIGRVAQRGALAVLSTLCTSVICASELRFGAERRGSTGLSARVDDLLGWISVEPWAVPADHIYARVRKVLEYARVRKVLEAAGTPISGNDMLVAAHSLALNCILVTDNEREFSRVPGLSVENWLRTP